MHPVYHQTGFCSCSCWAGVKCLAPFVTSQRLAFLYLISKIWSVLSCVMIGSFILCLTVVSCFLKFGWLQSSLNGGWSRILEKTFSKCSFCSSWAAWKVQQARDQNASEGRDHSWCACRKLYLPQCRSTFLLCHLGQSQDRWDIHHTQGLWFRDTCSWRWYLLCYSCTTQQQICCISFLTWSMFLPVYLEGRTWLRSWRTASIRTSSMFVKSLISGRWCSTMFVLVLIAWSLPIPTIRAMVESLVFSLASSSMMPTNIGLCRSKRNALHNLCYRYLFFLDIVDVV